MYNIVKNICAKFLPPHLSLCMLYKVWRKICLPLNFNGNITLQHKIYVGFTFSYVSRSFSVIQKLSYKLYLVYHLCTLCI